MILLETVETWDAAGLLCRTRSHLDATNPLRRDGRLATICGVEYGLQAAALHGGLRAGHTQAAGYVASLRAVALHAPRLDDPAFGTIRVTARLQAEERFGLVYDLALETDAGAPLLTARASIALPR